MRTTLLYGCDKDTISNYKSTLHLSLCHLQWIYLSPPLRSKRIFQDHRTYYAISKHIRRVREWNIFQVNFLGLFPTVVFLIERITKRVSERRNVIDRCFLKQPFLFIIHSLFLGCSVLVLYDFKNQEVSASNWHRQRVIIVDNAAIV